ncbi:polymer-forming cytoskeletal protein [bacterium]|nr:polymer-forming cytoskeletal protein [bacterium]
MKEKKKEFNPDKITGFFDKDTQINGDLTFKGSFRIDGYYKGNINSESVLIIGENGRVEADIKVSHIIVDGEIKGNIQASEKAEIHSNGRVIGTIISPKLIVEEGSYLEANCQTTDQGSPAPSQQKVPEKSPSQGTQS